MAAARSRHKILLADMPSELNVVRYDLKWTAAWDFFIGQSPKTFYETLCCNIDGTVKVYLDLLERGEDNFSVYINKNGRTVFKSENKIDYDAFGKILRFEEWVNEEIDSRRKGIGLNLFKNIFEVAEKGGIGRIELRAGKDDGKYFWARHGFYLKDEHYCQKMVQQIQENLQKYSDTLPAGIVDLVQNIIDHTGLDLPFHVARLDAEFQGKPLGWKLMEGYNPEYRILMHDKEQLARVRASFQRPVVAPIAVPAP